MRLNIKNRSRQDVDLHIFPPLRDGKPVCPSVLQVDAGHTMKIEGPTRQVRAILAAIKRRGPVPRGGAVQKGTSPGLVTEVFSDG